MIASRRLLLLSCGVIATLPAISSAQARRAQGACAQITAACREAGFVQGGAKSGTGLQKDCVQPILQGTDAPRRASKPLPKIASDVIAACRAQNPQFGNATQNDAGAGAVPPPAPAPVVVSHPAAPGSPNIIFILTDDLAMNLVQYMPHVLAMQKNGVTFANYFVTDSLCCPSRSSIFTGRYPHDTGVFKNVGEDGGYLVFKARGNEQATFAVALAAAGYRTAFMGKYLNGYEPAQHPAGPGWSHWMVAGNGYPQFRYALNDDGQLVRHGTQPEDYLTDVLAADAVHFIQLGGQPFFIEVATFSPHAPYTPAPRDADAFPGLHAPRTAAYNAAHDPNAPRWLASKPALTQADMDAIDRDFRKRAQSVLAVDKMIGQLEAAVAAAGQAQNTYFIFSSDNGYHMGEYRLMPGKMTAYDTDIHVPLVMTGPGVAAGRTASQITENVDLCPTFEELAGAAEQLPNVDGASLVPLLRGSSVTGWRTAALVEHHGPVRDLVDPDMPIARSGNPTTYEAIRSQASLYVEYADGGREFHDLAADPDELRNTFSSISASQKATLHKTLTDAMNCHSAKECWTAQGGSQAGAEHAGP